MLLADRQLAKRPLPHISEAQSTNMRNAIVCVLAGLMLLGAAVAQVGSTVPERATSPAPAPEAQLPSAPAGVPGETLSQLDRTIENTRVDLAKVRIDKWKADANSKRQAEENIGSLQRNMTEALPGIVAQVSSNPASVAAAFKLYRNLNALYDVLASVTESAGAFGSRDEYQSLANDTSSIDRLRRSLADQVEQMANAKDSELARIQAQLAQARQAAVSAPPKKIIVDENEPVKKPAPKKKKKPAPPATPTPPQ